MPTEHRRTGKDFIKKCLIFCLFSTESMSASRMNLLLTGNGQCLKKKSIIASITDRVISRALKLVFSKQPSQSSDNLKDIINSHKFFSQTGRDNLATHETRARSVIKPESRTFSTALTIPLLTKILLLPRISFSPSHRSINYSFYYRPRSCRPPEPKKN